MVGSLNNSVGNTGLTKELGDFNVKHGYDRNPAQSKMGKDEFLKLLTTQLSKQDPLEPMKNKEFIAQMAQFSSLEQMNQMNKKFEKTEALNYLGKEIQYSLDNGNSYSGKVEKAFFKGNEVKLTVSGRNISIDQITAVTPDSKGSESSANADSSQAVKPSQAKSAYESNTAVKK